MTNDERQAVIDLMGHANIVLDQQIGKNLHFTTPIREDDVKAVQAYLKPDHFTPQYQYRSVHLMSHWQGGWYCTSDIRGVYRGYKCRRSWEDHDTGNIFAHHANPLECARLWLEAYRKLDYNRIEEMTS